LPLQLDAAARLMAAPTLFSPAGVRQRYRLPQRRADTGAGCHARRCRRDVAFRFDAICSDAERFYAVFHERYFISFRVSFTLFAAPVIQLILPADVSPDEHIALSRRHPLYSPASVLLFHTLILRHRQ